MLSARKVERARPKKRRYALGDVPGLQLAVMPTGTKSWIYRHGTRGSRRSLLLGHHPERSLNWARQTARKLRMAANLSEHPLEAIERYRRKNLSKGPTLEDFASRWYVEIVIGARKDPLPVKRMMDREVLPRLGGRQIQTIQAEDLRRLIFAKRDAGRPEAAAALRHLLKRLFDYAVVCGEVQANPIAAVPLKYITKHRSRTRTLSERELKAFLQRCRSAELGRTGWALELMLLTLCRKSELRLARWEHVNVAARVWEIPAELSKTGKAHIVYLSNRAALLFDRLASAAGRSRYVLPKRDSVTEPITASALNKAVNRVKWGIERFTPHDLRRTASTLLNERGYNPDWIERALNHVQGGVRGVYNRAKYAEERRRMLQEWADYLEGLANG